MIASFAIIKIPPLLLLLRSASARLPRVAPHPAPRLPPPRPPSVGGGNIASNPRAAPALPCRRKQYRSSRSRVPSGPALPFHIRQSSVKPAAGPHPSSRPRRLGGHANERSRRARGEAAGESHPSGAFLCALQPGERMGDPLGGPAFGTLPATQLLRPLRQLPFPLTERPRPGGRHLGAPAARHHGAAELGTPSRPPARLRRKKRGPARPTERPGRPAGDPGRVPWPSAPHADFTQLLPRLSPRGGDAPSPASPTVPRLTQLHVALPQ